MLAALALSLVAGAPGVLGYYRQPALGDGALVFVAEGDLFRVSPDGGLAARLTTHPGLEQRPAISPDGQWVAFDAEYEGWPEVYVMPLAGGPPRRLSFDGGDVAVVGFTPGGKVLVRTDRHSTLPGTKLVELDPAGGPPVVLPLDKAADGSFDAEGRTFFFTRFVEQGSRNRRYRGGWAESIWRFDPKTPGAEATPLFPGETSVHKHPLVVGDRVVFVGDRDGHLNLWSCNFQGGDLVKLTDHRDFEVKKPTRFGQTLVYQAGPDLYRLELGAGRAPVRLDVHLQSDLDHRRRRWLKDPWDYVTHAFPSPDGDRVALSLRGRVVVLPVGGPGRAVLATPSGEARFREAQFLPGGRELIALADSKGELDLHRLPANGTRPPEWLSSLGPGHRSDLSVSPDGAVVAYRDRDQQLFLYDLAKRQPQRIAKAPIGLDGGAVFSPDGRLVAYVELSSAFVSQIVLHDRRTGRSAPVTSDRVDSYSPAFSPDGAWLYFLSDRRLKNVVPGIWGPRQPEPYFDAPTKIYAVQLDPKARFPFDLETELDKERAPAKAPDKPEPAKVEVELRGALERLFEVPVEPGNYARLGVAEGYLSVLGYVRPNYGQEKKGTLFVVKVEPTEKAERKKLADDVLDYDVTLDAKKLLVFREKSIVVVPAGEKLPDPIAKHEVSLEGLSFPIDPPVEWRQMFLEAWRFERDWFYDPKLHGVDWAAVRDAHAAVLERVSDRAELADLIASMVSELEALHTFVVGGDFRRGPDRVEAASLGARFRPGKLGAELSEVFVSDPDYPELLAPAVRPGVDLRVGDQLTRIDGAEVKDGGDVARALIGKAKRRVRLEIAPAAGGSREAIATPISAAEERDLRYRHFELSRRLLVEERSKGRVGYVHLRAMGGADFEAFARQFYPVFDRDGLVIDVRNNRGGNIDSWVLEKLLRRAWFYWKGRAGPAFANMPFAFRGHMVTVINERTASDGEAFAEGFRRLGLGKLVGTRTWGGEIWLSFANGLVDKGIASAAETGVFGPEGAWLIEGHGVEPDVVVDNLPRETHDGRDRQLEVAVDLLLTEIAKDPRPLPEPPPYPVKRRPGKP